MDNIKLDFSNTKLPFSVNDLLTSSTGLLFIIGSFVAVALAFWIVPKLLDLIWGSFRKNKTN